MIDPPDRISKLADYLALVYHEGRNVRHLIRSGNVEPERFIQLVNLPTNKYQAWDQLQPLRERARTSETAAVAAEVFFTRFGLTLDDLLDLNANLAWRSYAPDYGGTAWRVIVEHVIGLRDALDLGDEALSDEILALIPRLGHNTVEADGVATKLALLDHGSQ